MTRYLFVLFLVLSGCQRKIVNMDSPPIYAPHETVESYQSLKLQDSCFVTDSTGSTSFAPTYNTLVTLTKFVGESSYTVLVAGQPIILQFQCDPFFQYHEPAPYNGTFTTEKKKSDDPCVQYTGEDTSTHDSITLTDLASCGGTQTGWSLSIYNGTDTILSSRTPGNLTAQIISQ